jgi:hypothetical protein
MSMLLEKSVKRGFMTAWTRYRAVAGLGSPILSRDELRNGAKMVSITASAKLFSSSPQQIQG